MDTLYAKDKIKLLLAAGMTEASIGEATGTTQSTVNRIKNGQDPRESLVRPIDALFKKKSRSINRSGGNKTS